MDDLAFIDQSQMTFENSVGSFMFKSFSPKSYSTDPSFSSKGTRTDQPFQAGFEKPAKLLKSNNWNCLTHLKKTPKPSSSSSSSNIITFGNSDSPPDSSNQFYGHSGNVTKDGGKNFTSSFPQGRYDYHENRCHALKSDEGTERVCNITTRTLSQAQDHVLAERKRRERLTERFIALSALLPGLKKMDKASVLGNAITHIKQLQERVKTLEEEAREREDEGFASENKFCPSGSDIDVLSSDGNSYGRLNKFSPEIEIRVSSRSVLVRIYCDKHAAFITMKTITEMQKLCLSIMSSSVMPFANTHLLITVIAQMDAEFCMTTKELVKNLRSAILESM
ncbi:hypothetical protein RJ640_030639 [Escallonia rubra]|uniref:BHLH domain-containing protein n=1 Tax=Escallonia rubra TaxID=112253 RepID=A0AA88S095_9ASTE|nr:hypothetical protein RJ640_030639 [Escallonia rubra]